MITCPTADELRSALTLFDQDPTPPSDPRRQFLARVADNARALLDRESALGDIAQAEEQARLRDLLDLDGPIEMMNHRLCQDLKAGVISPRAPALLAHLRATAIARIAIDQPGYSGLEALLAG
ncbi:DUF6285 domain-containing protein [Caulobacter henricii]|uniref:Protein kinase n=1 Tax=Caulobacter henricii TaxID=69395 RepID=A0A0P0P0I6_9CAUL|nr:DUF6285 domain-containing protein [Caulobacter henricii]ALL13599.1 protein kinase [Caulobacter henricii]